MPDGVNMTTSVETYRHAQSDELIASVNEAVKTVS